MEMYNWAQRQIDEATGMTTAERRAHQGSKECERRLKQMAKKREKDMKRRIASIPDGDGITPEIGAGSGD